MSPETPSVGPAGRADRSEEGVAPDSSNLGQKLLELERDHLRRLEAKRREERQNHPASFAVRINV